MIATRCDGHLSWVQRGGSCRFITYSDLARTGFTRITPHFAI